MEKKNRFSVAELSLIKALFADNEPMILTIRKFLLGGTMTKEETETIKGLSPEAHAVIRKLVLPQIDVESPLFHGVDLWVNINTKEQSLTKSYEDMLARQIVEDYLDTQLEIMKGKKVKNIDFLTLHKMDGKDEVDAVIDLMARNTILSHVDFQLYQAVVLSGKKEETVEQTQERLLKNSTK